MRTGILADALARRMGTGAGGAILRALVMFERGAGGRGLVATVRTGIRDFARYIVGGGGRGGTCATA